MKIRQGFVSNSSSSSFLLIGFEATKEQIEAYKKEEEGVTDGGGYDFGYDKNQIALTRSTPRLMGFRLPFGTSVKLSELQEQSTKLRDIYGDVEVRVWTGEEMC